MDHIFPKRVTILSENIFFPIFYKISEFIILLRYKNPIFSTSLLKKYLGKKLLTIQVLTSSLTISTKKKIKKKNLDVLIYYKKHKNKKYLIDYQLIKKLLELKLNIHCVGDKLKIKNINNYNLLSKKKLNLLLSKTKFSICSEENFYSLFTLDCINNNVKLITNIKNKNKIYKYRENFLFINSNYKNLKKILTKYAV